MILLPQKGNIVVIIVCNREVRQPMIQDHVAMCTYSTLFMMMGYLRGLQMARYRSYAITVRRTHSVEPNPRETTICRAQPMKEMDFLSDPMLLMSVGGMDDDV